MRCLRPSYALYPVVVIVALGQLSSVLAQNPADIERIKALLEQGEQLEQKGKATEAIRRFEQALPIVETSLGKKNVLAADLHYRIAGLYFDQGEYRKAEPAARAALAARETIDGAIHERTGNAAERLGETYTELGQYAKAEPLLQRALAIYEQRLGVDDSATAVVLGKLAKLYRIQAQYRKAEPLYLRSQRIQEKNHGQEHPDVAYVLNGLAILYEDSGQYAKALTQYERVLRIWETHLGKDHPHVAAILQNLGGLHHRMAEFAQAEKHLRRSLSISEARFGQRSQHLANVLHSLGNLYKDTADYSNAKTHLLRALDIEESHFGKQHPNLAGTFNDLAGLYHQMADYRQAEVLFQRAHQLVEAQFGRNHPAVAGALHNRANTASDLGQLEKAESLFQQSLQIAQTNLGADHPQVATCLQSLGGLHVQTKRYQEAETCFRRAAEILESKLGKNHPAAARALISLAALHQEQKDYDRAEPLYRRALAIFEAAHGKDHPDVADAVDRLAGLQYYRQRPTESLAFAERAVQVAEVTLGRDHPTAAYYASHVSAAQAALDHWPEATAAADRSRRAFRRFAQRVLPALSEAEQLMFLRTMEGTFHSSLSLALAHVDDPALMSRSANWLLNGKGLAHHALAERTLLASDSGDPRIAETAQQLKLVRSQIAALSLRNAGAVDADMRRRLDDLGRQEQALTKELGRAGGRAGREDAWVELEDVRGVLPKDAVLIEMARVVPTKTYDTSEQPPRYLAWIIPPRGDGDVRLVDLGEASAIEGAIHPVRRALAGASEVIRQRGEAAAEQELRKSMQTLAERLLGPLVELVRSKRRWIVSPDAAAWLVPWAALPLEDGGYVVEKHQVSYVVSGRDLVASTAKIETNPPVVMADPNFDLGLAEAQAETQRVLQRDHRPDLLRSATSLAKTQWARLPGTAAEAEAIRATLERFAKAKPYVYTDQYALEGVLKAFAKPKVAVLSTHGFFLGDQEMAAVDRPAPGTQGSLSTLTKQGKPLENPLLRCGLVFAGANHQTTEAGQEDGVLTGLEIVGLDLRGCELVVLSACETGLGDVRNGEGVAGLRQAFQLAGAQSVVATLWQIPDRDSALIMSDFFDQLARGRGKADALREAQLARIKARRERSEAAHPFFWAAFTLTGHEALPQRP